jgi:hypothetical protein
MLTTCWTTWACHCEEVSIKLHAGLEGKTYLLEFLERLEHLLDH